MIDGARHFSATDTFSAMARLAELRRSSEQIFADIDALLVPTTPTVYTIEAVRADPLRLNSRLGLYTNFVNLLDLAALAVPDAMRADGVPFGITLIAPAWSEAALLDLGARWQAHAALPLGATLHPQLSSSPRAEPPSDRVQLAVVGAHLSGMPLNAQLTSLGATRSCETTTASAYRLFALAGTTPPKPGLQRVARDGVPIALEV